MSDDKINPSLVKMAHSLLEGHMDEVVAAAGELQKEGFVPLSAIKASQGMPPGAPMPPQPPQPPMAPGAPMPPAGPTPAAGPMPPGGMPPDPSMMGGMPPGGMPPDPSMMGGAPPGGGQMIAVGLEDLMMLFSQIAEQQGAQAAEADAMEGPNEGSEPATTNKQLGQRIDSLDEKLDMLLQAIGMPAGGPGGEMGGMGGAGGEEIPPELAAAMGAVPPPDVAGGMPPEAMGAPMPPEMAAAAPTPMVGGPPPGGGMPVMASDNGGMKKTAAVSVSKLAARLRRR